MICIKIHNSYRSVVALCDSELLGRRFEEGKRELFLRENFYKEEEKDLDTIVSIIKNQMREDAIFNIVGEESINAALKAGLITERNIDSIDNIPFTMTFL